MDVIPHPSLQPPLSHCRYEWVDVGMLEYDAGRNRYLVKRVHVPNHVLEKAERAKAPAEGMSVEEKNETEKKGVLIDNSGIVPVYIYTQVAACMCTGTIISIVYHAKGLLSH